MTHQCGAAPGAVGRAEGQKSKTLSGSRNIIPWQARARAEYHDFLNAAPGPDTGEGHVWPLRAAHKARRAGVSASEAVADIKAAMPRKPLRVIQTDVETAYKGREGARTFTPAPRTPQAPKADTGRLWDDSTAAWPEDADGLCELTEKSPRRFEGAPELDFALLLRERFDGGDILYSGGLHEIAVPGKNLQPARDWIAHVEAGGKLDPHFTFNPLTGREGTTASGKPSFRADNCVAAWRYCLVEFDKTPIWKQAAFWLRHVDRLNVAAIIHSGGKSLHALLEVDCPDAAAWARKVKPLYAGILRDLGADAACSNPARMSRTPGRWRTDFKSTPPPPKERLQRLVWLRGRA